MALLAVVMWLQEYCIAQVGDYRGHSKFKDGTFHYANEERKLSDRKIFMHIDADSDNTKIHWKETRIQVKFFCSRK